MNSRGGRRLAVACVAGGLVVLLVFLVVSWESTVELWWISKLGSGDGEARAEALDRLREAGGERAARSLLQDLREGGRLGDGLVTALTGIYPRLGAGGRARVLEGLFGYLPRAVAIEGGLTGEAPLTFVSSEAIREAVRTLLERLGGPPPDAFPILTGALRHPFTRGVAVPHLLRGWPESREEIRRFAAEGPPRALMDFCGELEDLTRDRSAEVLRDLALGHEKPEVRAIALAHASRVPDLLKKAFFGDPDHLVRRTAVRMAASQGDAVEPEALDLSALLFSEEDPRLLAEIVEARTLRAYGDPPGRRFEVTGGLIPGGDLPQTEARSFAPEERRRLGEILEKETYGPLRDAASLALAPRFEPWTEAPPALASFKVHEWGVFGDGGEVLAAPEKLLADLPGFVHRSRVGAARLWQERSYSSSIALKPVLFFYSDAPAVIDLQVRFTMGRPWTFYPDANDYLEAVRSVPEPGPGETPAVLFKDLAGLEPPWLPKEPVEEADPPLQYDPFNGSVRLFPAGELRSRYALVPWTSPLHGLISTDDFRGTVDLAGIGLEWRGLRIGFGPKLEGEFKPAPPGSWWERLRDTPSSPVAIRGEHEKFLFYDGAVRLRAPVVVSWADPPRSALSLRVRPFSEYPLTGEALAGLRIPPTAFIPGALVIRKSGSTLRAAFLPNLPPETDSLRVPLDALDLVGGAVRDRLEAVLIGEGLTEEEARGLLFAWEKEFFEAEGLRVITVLPGWIYDSLLPLEMRPEPAELVRVGLVWKEVKDLPVEAASASAPSQQGCVPIDLELETSQLEIRESPLALEASRPFTRDAAGRIHGLAGKQFPALSGNGKRIALLPSIHSLHIADLDSETVTRLAPLPPGKQIEEFTISRDGNRVALMVSEGPGRNTVEVADLARGILLEVLRTKWRCADGKLSADGSRIALHVGGRPVILDVRAGLQLTPSFEGVIDSGWPSISYDGTKLALFREASDVLLLDLSRPALFRVAEGSPWGAFFPMGFSSTGRRILVPGAGKESEESCATRVDLDGCRQVRFRLPRQDSTEGDRLPALSPDGNRALFLFHGALWSVDLESGASRKILALPGGQQLTWVSVSEDLKRVLYRAEAEGGRGATGLYLLDFE